MTGADEHVDVLIVGAGLSGIGAGCHLRMSCPGKTFAILEARDVMGGTWDLFRYPGIRSDSDMFTLGYPFRPWREAKAIADGPSFRGEVVRPQFWPAGLDYAGKRVVVIGSGATAVTVVPAMAATAAHVTMLQRSPTWVGVVPGRDKLAD